MIVANPRRAYTLRDPRRSVAWIAELNALVHQRRIDAVSDAPFCSGLVGYIGYEALASHEPSLDLPKSPYALPAAQFGAYNAAALFDRARKKAFISARSKEAARNLEEVLGNGDAPPISLPDFEGLQSNFSATEYNAAVADVIERIRNGDFFQANIAQTLTANSSSPFSAFSLFRKLAATSDAFFSALFQYEEGAIISNSPERFFSLVPSGRILTEPVKGTRPRGETPEEDRRLSKELLNDRKDRAENIMIADLMRNDLSRICEDYSVKEEAVCELMTLSRVHHLVSRISGRLRAGLGAGDIFRALFPCGSITGAPKIDAMKTIGEIERRGRGPYCGAIGYIDDRGGADFSVAIRTMMVDAERRHVSIPVGGGVTLRSDPDAEYQETLVKARSALAALNISAERLP